MPRVFGLLSNRDSFQRIRDAAKAEWRGMTVGPRPLHLAVCAGMSIPVQAGGIFAQDQPFVQFGPSPPPRDVAHSNRDCLLLARESVRASLPTDVTRNEHPISAK